MTLSRTRYSDDPQHTWWEWNTGWELKVKSDPTCSMFVIVASPRMSNMRWNNRVLANLNRWCWRAWKVGRYQLVESSVIWFWRASCTLLVKFWSWSGFVACCKIATYTVCSTIDARQWYQFFSLFDKHIYKNFSGTTSAWRRQSSATVCDKKSDERCRPICKQFGLKREKPCT